MFESARLKLTGWYLLMIMIISLSFSGLVYRALVREVVRFEQLQRYRIEQLSPLFYPLPVNEELISETSRRAILFLGFINLGILIGSAVLGNILAGRTLAPIKEMVDDQNRFISDASHELKTPLTALKSSFEVYLRDKKRSRNDADVLVKDSIGDVNKLQYLSDSLLKLSKEGRTSGHQQLEDVKLDEIAQQALRKVTSLAKNKDIKLFAQLKSVKVRGQKYALTDLMVILLDNAIKYTPALGKITIKVSSTPTHAKVAVLDTGVGISKTDLPHIFDRFYRSDSARSRTVEGGYGLGLSIAKNIATDHHGDIKVTSRTNLGTTVTVYLPKM